jgi:hypothetical protein
MDASRHFKNKKRECVKDKINERTMHSKNKNIRDQYRGINEFKRGYQHRNGLVRDVNDNMLADSYILNSWKKYFSRLWNVHNVINNRQIESTLS